MGRRAKSPKSKANGKPSRARTEAPKDDDAKVRELEQRVAEVLGQLQARNHELAEARKGETEALEQQSATAEILQVISRSPTDVQPVFDTIVNTAARLCDAIFSALGTFDGERMDIVAAHNWTPAAWDAARRTWPAPPSRALASGRAIVDRAVVHIPDVQLDREYDSPEMSHSVGFRSILSVPMMRDKTPVGVIAVGRAEPGPFSESQVRLLQTFADQAVIAIENVRLFNETKEALEQQTATSEILKVIARSPTDTQPVFDAIAENAARLCGVEDGFILLVDGDALRAVSVTGQLVAQAPDYNTRRVPVSRASVAGRAIVDRATIHISDLAEVSEAEFPEVGALQRLFGHRTMLATPLLREGVALGAIVLFRFEVRPFSERQVELLKTFADQAVIAVENVRLFTELQASNRELTTALDTQTATSDILRVISRSQTDVQPVFDAIVASAVRLLGAYTGALTRIADDQIELVALTSADHAGDAAVWATFPQPIQSEGPYAQAMRDRAPLNVADAQSDPRWSDARARAHARGYRSWAVVPLLRHDEGIGAISVSHREPGGFTEDDIALLQTFADQAVIAIENARLLTELQQRNEALTQAHAQVTEALEQQTATSEVLKVISRSTFELQPVLETLVENAARLCGADWGIIYRLEVEILRVAAFYLASPEFRQFWREAELRPGRGSCAGRAAFERRTVHITDALAEPGYELTEAQQRGGYRTLLSVPMLRQGVLLGVFTMMRSEVRPFTDKQIELVTTFADQAVIAIENVRLLTELQSRTDELARSVEELKALSDVGQAVSSTLDLENVLNTIAARAAQLSAAYWGLIYEYDETTLEFHLRASHHLDDELVGVIRSAPIRLGEGVAGKAAAIRLPVQVADILDEQTYDVARIRVVMESRGLRSLLAVPLLFEQRIIGALVVSRREPGSFAPEVVSLLQTFASQSVLAIENARLFREIADKSRQLEVSSQHKSEFLANMSHELRTPLNAILGFSEVLADGMFGEVNEKQSEYLRDIMESGRHLLSLINDILDLSKIEAGRMELEPTDFDLPTAIDNALTLVRERAGRRGITLGRELDTRVGMIRGDERKVKQVLLNLLSNAIKFTPEGGQIGVRAAMSDGPVEVSVTDTGVGIAPEDQETVFEEFRQVGTADKKVEGTGLGLALSRKFIELHGGRIWVKSELGHGSTFTFTLPVRPGE